METISANQFVQTVDKSGETYIVYIDESMQGNQVFVVAYLVPVSQWKEALDLLIGGRQQASRDHGLFVGKELHTSEFLSGRGKYFKVFGSRELRAMIVAKMLSDVCLLPQIRLFTSVAPQRKLDWAFERIVNRIERHLQNESATFLLFCDEGKEGVYTPLVRLRRRYNPIPRKYGGNPVSVSLNRVVEDPVFLDSSRSYFVQQADLIAYALMRKYRPRSDDPFRINSLFDEHLSDICVAQASSHPFGIIEIN